MIAGKDSPKFGEAKNGWLAGTAAWNWIAISQYMLGVRVEFEGCVPLSSPRSGRNSRSSATSAAPITWSCQQPQEGQQGRG